MSSTEDILNATANSVAAMNSSINALTNQISAYANMDYQTAMQAIAQQTLDLQRQQTMIAWQQQAVDLSTQLGQGEIAITETKQNISAYEQFLSNFPAYADYQKASAMAAGKQQFDQLMGNFEMQAVQAAATGRAGAGTSVQRVTNQKRQDVADFVGDDMTLDAAGGLFGQGYNQLIYDLNTIQTQAQGQLDIYEQTLPILQETQEIAGGALETLTDMLPSSTPTWRDLPMHSPRA